MANNTNIQDQLQTKFALPYPDGASRHIVIWHDPEGEFEADFTRIADEDFLRTSDGAVACVNAHDGNLFVTKKRILRDDPTTSFLLYTKRARADIQGNWFADMEFYANHFQADYTSLLANDLDASDSADVRHGLQEMKTFFRAKDRVSKFKAKMPHVNSQEDVYFGVLAVLCGAKEAQPTSIISAYTQQLAAAFIESEPFTLKDELQKYEALEVFESLLRKITGFAGDIADAPQLIGHLLATALTSTVPTEELSHLSHLIAPNNAEFCLAVVTNWKACDDLAESSTLFEACEVVQAEFNLRAMLQGIPTEYLVQSEALPCIDELLLDDLFTAISSGSDRVRDAKDILAARGSTMWYQAFAPYYGCLRAAAAIQSFYLSHTSGFHSSQAAEVWHAYTQEWWEMDVAYRRFFDAYQASLLKPCELSESTQALSKWVDSIYANWFLDETNECWVKAAEQDWLKYGFAEGIHQQQRFFVEQVNPLLGKGKCLVVGICDGMRYGVGRELAEALERKTKGSATVTSMQAIFPTETKFGMAALLPNKKITYDPNADSVSVDDLPSNTTQNRQAILQKYVPKSAAIQWPDLLAMNPTDRKAFAEDLDVVYVYQNSIDKAGHGDTKGQDVFAACDRAIEDMCALVDTAVKHMGAKQVLITADHGFLFTHKDFVEVELLDKSSFSGEIFKAERRFICAESEATSELLLPMRTALDTGDGKDEGGGQGQSAGCSWWTTRNCVRIKTPGSRHYVHGGVSLQEMCVPVVRYTNKRTSSKDFVATTPAEIQLLTTNRRITNTIFNLDFFQTQPVGSKITPATYELAFTNLAGMEVSDKRTLCADKTEREPEERSMRVKFALKPGTRWDSKEPYYLVARDSATGQIAFKEEFHIEVTFAPVEDFGW